MSARARGQTVAVEVLVCGSQDRADDGAAIAACAVLGAGLPVDVRLRIVGQLDVDHLVSIAPDAAIVIGDAANGIEPGVVLERPLAELTDPGTDQFQSSHALSIPDTVALAEAIVGHRLRGRTVVIGGAEFGLGRPISPVVAAALPTLSRAVTNAIEHARLEDGQSRGGH